MFLSVFQVSLRSICWAMGLLALAGLAGCEPEPSPPPPEILGLWTTDAPRYHGRHFEIREDAIVFGTGEYSAALRHSLVTVESKPGLNGWTDIVIHYREPDGVVSDLELQYRSKPNEELQFAHRKETWRRQVKRKDRDV